MLQDDPLEDPQRDKDSSSSQSQSGSAGISASLNDSLSLSVSGYEASAARSASPSHSPSATPSTALSSQQQPLVLNDQQRLAAEAPSGAVLVLAGPGSGKTRVIAARVAHLVTSCGVRPSEILLVTFTNKAAREMESRVAAVLGEDLAAPISIATFHSTAFRLLRAHGAEIGLPRVSIFDPSDADDFFRELGARLGGPLATVKPSLLISSISKLKSSGTPMEVIERAAREGVEPQLGGKSLALPINLVLQAYREYERHLTQSHLIDFDDVLLFAVKLLKKCPQIARQFCHVLVDEFQDTNATQFLLAQLLAWSGNITIVGDPDQSIYGWRNADRTAFRNFRRRFPDATEVKLEQNYRSTQQILRLGSTMMRQDSTRDEMVLWTNNPAGPPVLFRTFATPVEEALMIAKSIVTYCRAFRGLVTLDDFAILIRAGYLTRELEQALVRTEMPFRMVGARRFFDRMEVRDLLAYLRLAANMFDFRAFMRAVDVPKRQVSDKLLQAIHAVASEQECSPIQVILDHADPQEQTVVSSLLNVRIINFARLIVDLHERSLEQGPSQCAVKHLLQQIVDATGYDRYLKREDPVSYESRRENIGELISLTETFDQDYSASQGQTRLESFLESVMLSDAASSTQSSQEGITISTIHAAKGLEWPFIFVAGVEDGIIPHSTAAEADILREERRLLYVAITRAMFAAQLSCANTRQVFGSAPAIAVCTIRSLCVLPVRKSRISPRAFSRSTSSSAMASETSSAASNSTWPSSRRCVPLLPRSCTASHMQSLLSLSRPSIVQATKLRSLSVTSSAVNSPTMTNLSAPPLCGASTCRKPLPLHLQSVACLRLSRPRALKTVKWSSANITHYLRSPHSPLLNRCTTGGLLLLPCPSARKQRDSLLRPAAPLPLHSIFSAGCNHHLLRLRRRPCS
eukprot:m.149616 g.149616  ORF g.149616 m.149616 type:complete len:918 (+) comp10134_c0_seq1:100-2853(+)